MLKTNLLFNKLNEGSFPMNSLISFKKPTKLFLISE